MTLTGIVINTVNLLIAVYMAGVGVLALVRGDVIVYITFTIIALQMSVLAFNSTRPLVVMMTMVLIQVPTITTIVIEDGRGSLENPTIYWITLFGLIGWIIVQIPYYVSTVMLEATSGMGASTSTSTSSSTESEGTGGTERLLQVVSTNPFMASMYEQDSQV